MIPRNELDGFTVFRPQETITANSIYLSANTFKIAKSSINYLNDPEYIIVFLDEINKRMMIAPCTLEHENAIKLVLRGGGKTYTHFTCKELAAKVKALSGCKKDERIWFPGHLAKDAEDKIIFELSRPIKRTS